VAVVGKKLEHQIEQLHSFGDFRFGHWFDRSRSGNEFASPYHGAVQSASALSDEGATTTPHRPAATFRSPCDVGLR
jgi:hypothetical protein